MAGRSDESANVIRANQRPEELKTVPERGRGIAFDGSVWRRVASLSSGLDKDIMRIECGTFVEWFPRTPDRASW